METTTTSLPFDLAATLRRTGISTYRTRKIVGLLPDRGRHELLQVLNDGTLDVFRTQWIENLGETLGTSTADAAYILRLLTDGVTR